jgi:hypothetical protein
MDIKVIRSVFTTTSTLGKMYINDVFFSYTLEDTDRHLNGNCAMKIPAKTAIDAKKYEMVLSYSARFKKYLPLLLSVPCFEGIRVHGGNTHENSEGCILIGEHSNMKDRIWNCPSKVNQLVSLLKSVQKKEKIWIEIEREVSSDRILS